MLMLGPHESGANAKGAKAKAGPAGIQSCNKYMRGLQALHYLEPTVLQDLNAVLPAIDSECRFELYALVWLHEPERICLCGALTIARGHA